MAADPPSHYAILNLPTPARRNPQALSPRTLKRAYHAALLAHHPDKHPSDLPTPPPEPPSSTPPSPLPAPPQDSSKVASTSAAHPTVDAITAAYRTLATPALRAAYDRSLVVVGAAHAPSGARSASAATRHAGGDGLETTDLEDWAHEAAADTWSRSCGRCGLARGFVVTAEDLETAAQDAEGGGDGEVLVGCGGCSLWVRVTFRVVGTDEEDAIGEGRRGTADEGRIER